MDLLDIVHDDPSAHKPFCCSWEECSKAFARRSDLVRHERIHSNDRPWVCTWPGCTRDFIQRSALTVHTRVHTGERPHHCEYPSCDKAFSDSSSLARHRRIHTGKRPYKCPTIECGKTYCRRVTLMKHIKKYHPSSPTFSHGSWDSTAYQQPPSPSGSDLEQYDHEEDYYQPEPLPLPNTIHSPPEEPRYRTRRSTTGPSPAYSSPADLEQHEVIRRHLERHKSGEAAYLTPPPHHSYRMSRNPSFDEETYNRNRLYAASSTSSSARPTPSPEPRFVHPRQYPSPPPSIISRTSSPHQTYTYPPHVTTSAPLPQLEFIAPPQHYQHLHQPTFASPLQHSRGRRASSTPAVALDFAAPLSSGPTPGLGIEFVSSPEPTREGHVRRFSEVAGLAPAYDDYAAGYSSFTSSHFAKMDEEALVF